MKTFLVAAICLYVSSCERKGEKEVLGGSFTRPETYTLVDPIPKDDGWLQSFKRAEGYKKSWETWVWRLTDIEAGSGIKVYARNSEEKQFLLTGYDYFENQPVLIIDFRSKKVMSTGYYAGEHNVKLSPSENYIVCIAQNPRSYLSGLPLDFDLKGGDYKVVFSGDAATWTKKTEQG